MDSPLLPTLRRNPGETASPTALMANMTLEPMSPSDSFSFHPQQQQPAPAHSSHSHSQSSSSSQLRAADADESVEGDSDAWDTPQPKKKTQPRFSLFAPQTTAQRPSPLGGSLSSNAVEEKSQGGQDGQDADEVQRVQRTSQRGESSAARDDKLRESLYELRQMNEVFDGFLNALQAARGHNQRLAARAQQTSKLLDQYTAILGQQEHTLSLVLNPKWTGAQDDLRALEKEEAERAAAAAEAARLAETQRLAQQAAREKASKDSERSSSETTRGGARGRGSTRGLARGSGIPRSSVAPGTRPATSLRKPSGGLGSQYANVKSSGYGPNARKT